jgi:hypothetical protein
MLKHLTSLASAFAAGSAALLISAPIASAEDPPPCNPDDQQCQEQQNPGPAIADQVIDNVQQGVDQAQQALPQPQERTGTGIMVLLNGVPHCMELGKPVPPGVVRPIHPSGLTSYC